jgi:glycerol-3-phosphate dehydrogenase (NAD(P)+)
VTKTQPADVVAEAVARVGGTAESVKSSAAVLALARAKGVDMPITAGVAGVVHRGMSVRELGAQLMGRPYRAEGRAYRKWRRQPQPPSAD